MHHRTKPSQHFTTGGREIVSEAGKVPGGLGPVKLLVITCVPDPTAGVDEMVPLMKFPNVMLFLLQARQSSLPGINSK